MAVYSVVQLLIPVPEFGAGNLTVDGSINSWVDQKFLPGNLHRPTYDPEGLLCSLSASVMTLTGAFIGTIIRSNKYSGNKNALIILSAGLFSLLIGLIISPYYPIVKKVWTTSFNLSAGGIILLLTGVFYWIIDVRNHLGWTFFFRVIGLNSITIYMLCRIVDFKGISQFLFGGLAGLTGDLKEVVIFTGVLTIEWILLYFLFKNKIFLKI